jgi:hypothetical protein
MFTIFIVANIYSIVNVNVYSSAFFKINIYSMDEVNVWSAVNQAMKKR